MMQTVYMKETGTPVQLDGCDVREYVAGGLATMTPPEDSKAGKEVAAAQAEKDSAPVLMSNIVDVICTLDRNNKELWANKGKGKPHVVAIEASLGQDITAAQRDEAWSLYLDAAALKDGK